MQAMKEKLPITFERCGPSGGGNKGTGVVKASNANSCIAGWTFPCRFRRIKLLIKAKLILEHCDIKDSISFDLDQAMGSTIRQKGRRQQFKYILESPFNYKWYICY